MSLLDAHLSDSSLMAYLAGELAPQERRQVAQHCAQCPHCEARLATEQRLRQRLQGTLPGLGKRRTDELVRLLPAIMGETGKPPAIFNRLAVGVALLLLLFTLLPMLPAFESGPELPGNNGLSNVPISTSTPHALEMPHEGTFEAVANANIPGKALQNPPDLQYASPAPLPQATLEASDIPGND